VAAKKSKSKYADVKHILHPTKRAKDSKRNSTKYNSPMSHKEKARRDVRRDSLLSAKPVGWRRSASGKKYYEARANRSDFAGKNAKPGRRL